MAEMHHLKVDHTITIEVNKVTRDTVTAVALWCGGVEVVEHDALQHDVTFPAINVPTNQGMKRAQEGDYVVKRLTGSFVIIQPRLFNELFEPVTPATPI